MRTCRQAPAIHESPARSRWAAPLRRRWPAAWLAGWAAFATALPAGAAAGGATVAVVGRSPGDDVALAAADVSAALSSAGSSTAEWGVQLASDDVRDAAFAIRLAHRAKQEARLGLLLTVVPGLGASLGVAFALLPPAVAPLSAVMGTVAALFRLRSREG